MNVFTRIGNYIEKHWPEKMTPSDVHNLVGIRFSEVESRISAIEITITSLDDKISKLTDLVKTLLTQATIKSRIIGDNPSNMTPFASRLQPVHPAMQAGSQNMQGGAK